MALVSVEQLKEYTGNNEPDDIGLNDIYISSAEQVVIDYLGYDPNTTSYSEYFSGLNDYVIYLSAQPITSINRVVINGVEIDSDIFEFNGRQLTFSDRKTVFPLGIDNIYVEYDAGYDDIPGIIQLTILRIASILLQEANGNIGITGKAFGDNSRTFINYTDFKKYLRPLDSLRIIRI